VDAAGRELGHVVVGHAGAVLDPVDAGGEHVVDGLAGERVDRHARAVLVGGRHGVGEHVDRPQGREVGVGAERAVDPVADELDPAVPAARLLRHDLRQVVHVLQLAGEVADVALRAGDVLTRADESGEVLALLHPAVVDRGPGVADEQRADVPVEDRLLLGALDRRGAVGPDPDVRVHVDQTRHDDAADLLERRHVLGGGHVDGAVGDPDLVQLPGGAHEDRAGQVHRSLRARHGPRIPRCRPAPRALSRTRWRGCRRLVLTGDVVLWFISRVMNQRGGG
jgi:hypothetical protein